MFNVCVFAGQNFIHTFRPYYLPKRNENWMSGKPVVLALQTAQDDPGEALFTQKNRGFVQIGPQNRP